MSTKDDFSTSEFRLKSRAAETLLTTSAKFLPELVGGKRREVHGGVDRDEHVGVLRHWLT